MSAILPTNHTFAVCAYKESLYLEKCIDSVVNQDEKTNVIICTPTPNEYIYSLAKKYDLEVFVNPNSKAQMQDSWNFALDTAKTDYVTICHQDDYYLSNYYSEVKKRFSDDVLYIHTNYYDAITDDNNSVIKSSKNVIMKRIIHGCFANKWQSNNIFFKRWDLRFGNSVCCPTCTYNKKNLPFPLFVSSCTHGVDWDLYINLASISGRVAYVKNASAVKRTHTSAQTNEDIASGVRAREDIQLYSKLWPTFFAKLLQILLSKFYKLN